LTARIRVTPTNPPQFGRVHLNTNFKQMKTLSILIVPLFLTIFFLSFHYSNATLLAQPISETLKINQFLNKTQQSLHHFIQFEEARLKLAPSMVLAGAFCFIAASISSAGGIGGGGLYIPVLTIVAGLDLKTASSFSAFMVTGGSIANVMCNMFTTSPKFGGKTLVDYDIALLSEPCMLLGVSVGVICNLVFPEWLVMVLFAIFLAWSTFKTCKNGVFHWRLETEEVKKYGCGNLDGGTRLVEDGSLYHNYAGSEDTTMSTKEPLLGFVEVDEKLKFPWMKLGILVMVWFSFSSLYLLRGNREGEGIIPIEPCGLGYWILSSLQIPLAIVFTVWIILRKENCQHQTNLLQTQNYSVKDMEDFNRVRGGPPNRLIFPIIALLAGILGGVFGIGGGMLISPLLLQVGIAPEYLMLGMKHTETALIFAIICFLASLLGLLVVQRAIKKHGRASLIVFSVSTVMALSTVLMTSFGALDVWRDYTTGRNMWFKLPC
ncbi:hypothetical protein Tsubulata_015893, partial [Turnera subulata]